MGLKDLVLDCVSLQLSGVIFMVGEAVDLDGQQRVVGHPVVDVDDEVDRRAMPYKARLPGPEPAEVGEEVSHQDLAAHYPFVHTTTTVPTIAIAFSSIGSTAGRARARRRH
jgi:hypothetical protein